MWILFSCHLVGTVTQEAFQTSLLPEAECVSKN